jgi:hypothetical protein
MATALQSCSTLQHADQPACEAEPFSHHRDHIAKELDALAQLAQFEGDFCDFASHSNGVSGGEPTCNRSPSVVRRYQSSAMCSSLDGSHIRAITSTAAIFAQAMRSFPVGRTCSHTHSRPVPRHNARAKYTSPNRRERSMRMRLRRPVAVPGGLFSVGDSSPRYERALEKTASLAAEVLEQLATRCTKS